jgi:hypothetical protein
MQKRKSLTSLQGFKYLAPRPGLEPGTHGLTVLRSQEVIEYPKQKSLTG